MLDTDVAAETPEKRDATTPDVPDEVSAEGSEAPVKRPAAEPHPEPEGNDAG